MQVRLAGRIGGWKGWALALALPAASSLGCSAIGAATSGVQSATSTAQGATGALDAAKGAVDQNVDKAKAEKDKASGGPKPGTAAGGVDGDNSRSCAKEEAINKPLTDNLDPKKGDPVDWKVFDLGGR